ncbi:glycoside hydrolase family 43 protein [Paenibacillus endoradicis]|uniref:glycoside hydrolase family 43 protein n=1 Tax=Paenibacillus endoradicis TaxID=2972487 RepID=UPI002158EB46|nr:glycoside hydrolase family 43 protein [Paenibacillus endoradicis]MCR8660097.1 glycoside hydrolase family 43 protein [Paenibacillus endoradicis]
MKFQNPIIPGFYPDPSICRAGDDYYIVTSSFGYFPGIPIWHSKDLVHWRQIGHCLTKESQSQLEGAKISEGVWAPTIRYHQGRFYMVTTNEKKCGHFYVWTDDPTGEWSEPIYVDQSGIDPSLLFEDGKVYFTSTGTEHGIGIYHCEIDIETGEKLTDTHFIWQGTGGKFTEAPHLYKINDYYYLMCAEGGTEYGHTEVVARSKSPYGPFESCPYNPILTHRSSGRKIQSTGHADLVQAVDGSWWAVFLGVRPVAYPYRHHIGRETFLAPVHWTEDGWPIIGNQGTVELEELAPNLPFVKWEHRSNRDEFTDAYLNDCWTFIRSGVQTTWSCSERESFLMITGSSDRLNSGGYPAFIGRRQQHHRCEVTVRMEYDLHEDDEAGLTVFMDDRHHYDLALTKVNGQIQFVLRRQIGSLIDEKYSKPIDGTDVEIRIEATKADYLFYYREGKEQWNKIGEGETRLLSTEVAGGFTGVFIAMYNYSRYKTKAYFDWYEYEGKE